MPIIPGAIVVPANIDDLSVTLEGARTLAQMYWYDTVGGNWDRAIGSAAGFLVDTELPAAGTLSDDMTNPTTPLIGDCLMVFDGSTWDRVRVGATAGSILTDVVSRAARDLGKVDIAVFDTQITPGDAQTTPTTSPPVASFPFVFNGSTWDLLREGNTDGSIRSDVTDRAARDLGKVDITSFDTAITPGDAQATPTTSPPVASFGMVFNGSDWDLMREGTIAGSIIADTELAAAATLTDAFATPNTAPVGAFNMIFNGSSWDFLREGSVDGSILTDVVDREARDLGKVDIAVFDTKITPADGQATPSTSPPVAAFPLVFNGTTWDLIREGGVDGSLRVDVVGAIPTANVTASGALGGLNETLAIAADAAGGIAYEIDAGTLAGTVIFEATYDNTNWFAINAIADGQGAEIASLTVFGVRGQVVPRAYSQVRLRVSLYTSGTSDARLEKSTGPSLVNTELPAAVTLGDAHATPTAPAVGAFGMVYNGGDWDMMREGATAGSVLTDIADRATRDLGKVDIALFDTQITPGDAQTTPTTSPPVASFGMVFNGSDWDLMREGTIAGSIIADTELPAAAAIAADDQAAPTAPAVYGFGMMFDGSTWDRMRGTSAGGLLVDLGTNNDVTVSGTVDITELPTAAALSDAFANPTVTQIGAFLMGWDAINSTWERVQVDPDSGDLQVVVTGLPTVDTELAAAVALADNITPANSPVVISALYGYESGGGVWDRVHVDASGYLQVAIAGAAVVDTELPAAAALTDAFANPTAPAVGAFLMGWDNVNSSWERVRVDPDTGQLSIAVDTELPAAAGLTDDFVTPTAPAVGAFGMMYDGATWDMMRGDATNGLLVNLGANNDVTVTGTVDITELPAAAALTDAFANPTVTQIGAFLMGYDAVAGNWERVQVDPDSGDLQVVVTSLPAVDTELAVAAALTDAFATPTTAPVGAFNMVYNGATWDFMREGNIAGSLFTDVTDRAARLVGVVTTEMSAAAALSDSFANPTAGGVGAFGMGFDGTDWERLRILQQPNAVGGRAPGNLAVGKTEGKATYRVAFKGLVAVAGVAVRIQGSATEILRVTKVMIAKPSVAQAPLRVVKCSSAPVDGTSTNPAGIPLDSADDAATGVVDLYTAAPTGGVEIGTGSIFEADLGTLDVVYEAFGDEQNCQAVVLRGTAETLEVELSAGATIDGYIEWTEE